MELTTENVSKIVKDCLYKENEDNSDAIITNGVICNFGFNPKKIESNKQDIYTLLKQLPKEFQKDSGGGMSFLNACLDNKGNQWGEHRDIDSLLCLGIASKQAQILLPKEFWTVMPGGIPYFVVL